MELWLLGAGAVVLVGLTLWIVWPAQNVETAGAPDPDEEDMLMTAQDEDKLVTPQDDQFEDRYTSATADLSAGGVAAALESMQEEDAAAAEAPPPTEAAPIGQAPPTGQAMPTETPAPTPTAYGAAGEPWSSPTMAREGVGDAGIAPSPPPVSPEPQPGRPLAQPRTIGIGAAVALAIASAVLGAWLYARWQRRRNAPVNRARRRLRRAQQELASAVRDLQKELGPNLRHSQKELGSSLRKTRKELRSSRFADAVRG